jgi:mannosylglycerate hydrolase
VATRKAAASPVSVKTGIVVSHSHWDRAWYLPFETFRHRLVRMVDRLIELLDRDDRFRAFTLDGQTVLIEDYLEIRPERADDLQRLIRTGRLLIGPWYVSPDLFLVSGEAIIRNLQRGLHISQDLGGRMPVGYVPDPFGHIAQMPQILQGFGIDTYVFMRGLDEETKECCGAIFDWVAPDGSSVLAVYQRDGYFNAAALGHPGIFGRFDGRQPSLADAEEQIREAVQAMAPLQAHDTLLFSNGMDHMPEQPELPDLLEQLNESLDGLHLEQGTLAEFFEAIKREAHPRETYSGDLLGNADHPILLSVYSTRMYLKQQNHAAQSLLAGIAEPLAAMGRATGQGPDAQPFLDHAWRELLRNHPHDDICGCSVDAVHLDNEARFRHVMEIGDAVAVEALETLVGTGLTAPARTGERSTDVFVFNPHPRPQRYRVVATILFPNDGGEFGTPPDAEYLEACDGDGRDVAVTVLATEAGVMRNRFLEQTWGRRYEIGFEVDVPATGYTLVHVYGSGQPLTPGARSHVLDSSDYRLAVKDNGLTLLCKNGGVTFSDFLRFEYQSDAGDTYSFSPVPDRAPVWSRFVAAAPHPTDPSLIRARYQLTVPESLDSDTEVTLDLTVDLGLDPTGLVATRVRYRNQARNGRLRAVLPTGFVVDRALAGAHFRLAERERPETISPEDAPERYEAYPGELVYASQHHEDYVVLEGPSYTVCVADRGLPEYELIPDGGHHAVALTLHRAVGYLSVRNGRIRRCGAGPEVPTPGAQCLREIDASFSFGVSNGPVEEVVQRGRAFAHPAWAREIPYLPHLRPSGSLPRVASLLEVDDPGVHVSAFKPEDRGPGCVLRLYNPTPEDRRATVRTPLPFSRYCETDLGEEWVEETARPVTGSMLSVDLPAYRIVTLILRGSGGRS